MKRISTLFAFVPFITFAGAQTINETFENYSSLSHLTTKCWSFCGLGLSTTTGISGAKSLVIISTRGNGVTVTLNKNSSSTLAHTLKVQQTNSGTDIPDQGSFSKEPGFR